LAPDTSVAGASYVGKKRATTDRRVIVGGSVVEERGTADGRVEVAGGVAKEG